ncbi:MAG: DEAD/DEAH box helicase [Cryomorphaceae bacterium]|nr:DEAD/DEAH box helicase [Flavobacteriales bacterium]
MNNRSSSQRSRRPGASTADSGQKNRRPGASKNRPQSGGRGGARGGKSRPVKAIDIKLLTKDAVPLQAETYVPTQSFADMPFSERLQETLRKKGYTHPTAIQSQTIEALLDGRDMMGIAQTGTGKTAAFLLPLIERMLNGEKLQTLVVVPTRELALQVNEEFKSLTKGLGLFSSCYIGGTNINRDLQNLRRQSHLVVGTPGRLLDLANRNALRLANFPVLILDEFDRMLDMGFAPDVNRITRLMESRTQTLLFSATVDKTQKKLIDGLLNNPVEVRVSEGEATGDHIQQDIVRVGASENKFDVLLAMLAKADFDKVLLFAETKRTVDRMTKMLKKSGLQAEQIHGNKSQNARQTALTKFKDGKIQVLVATDVAARGIDVSDVTHVINYQIPQTYDSYVHRIGRTGRAGKTGKAFTFVD